MIMNLSVEIWSSYRWIIGKWGSVAITAGARKCTKNTGYRHSPTDTRFALRVLTRLQPPTADTRFKVVTTLPEISPEDRKQTSDAWAQSNIQKDRAKRPLQSGNRAPQRISDYHPSFIEACVCDM